MFRKSKHGLVAIAIAIATVQNASAKMFNFIPDTIHRAISGDNRVRPGTSGLVEPGVQGSYVADLPPIARSYTSPTSTDSASAFSDSKALIQFGSQHTGSVGQLTYTKAQTNVDGDSISSLADAYASATTEYEVDADTAGATGVFKGSITVSGTVDKSTGGFFDVNPVAFVIIGNNSASVEYDNATDQFIVEERIDGALTTTFVNGLSAGTTIDFEFPISVGDVLSINSFNWITPESTGPGNHSNNSIFWTRFSGVGFYGDLPADIDGDDDVDEFDGQAIRGGIGISSGATLADGDVNGDGAVTNLDYLIWQRYRGVTLPSPAIAEGTAVPEPSTAVLAIMLAGAFCTTSRLRQGR